jgi:glycosyltransferase involved in cell wall biosynthesis
MANQTLQLRELLEGEGIRVELIQVNAPYRPAWIAPVRGLRAIFRLVPYLFSLWRALGRSDVAHLMANSGWSWHLFVAPAIWLGYLRGTPVIVNYRGGYAGEFLATSARWVRFSMRRAARLIVPSGFLQQEFARHGMSADIVPNIVDTARFRPGGEKDSKRPVILVARNLELIYDNACALDAFSIISKRVPEARLVIAGSGPEEGRLKDQSVRLGVAEKINFVGRVDAADMPALYRTATVALNTSRVDNMPNSVLEALAAGVPVVSTSVGGVPFVVEHERTALLVPPNHPEATASAILRLLDDDDLWQRLRQAGVEESKRYTWARVKPALMRVYDEALPGRADRTAVENRIEP